MAGRQVQSLGYLSRACLDPIVPLRQGKLGENVSVLMGEMYVALSETVCALNRARENRTPLTIRLNLRESALYLANFARSWWR